MQPREIPYFPQNRLYVNHFKKVMAHTHTAIILYVASSTRQAVGWFFRRRLWVSLCSSEIHPSKDHGQVHKRRGSGGFLQVTQLLISQQYARGTQFAAQRAQGRVAQTGKTSQGSRGRRQKCKDLPLVLTVTGLKIKVTCCGGVKDGRTCGLLCYALGKMPSQVSRHASRARFCTGTLPPKPQVKTCITEAAVSREQGAHPLLLIQSPSAVPAVVWTCRHHLFFCTSKTNSFGLRLAVVRLKRTQDQILLKEKNKLKKTQSTL